MRLNALRASFSAASPFLRAMLTREITNKYQQSLIGFVWLLIQPLFLLLIYHFVFAHIFKIRFDTTDAVQGYSFIAYLAVGLWPWSAFSEGINAATGSIDKHKSVLSKIALPSQLLVLVEILVPYLVHGLGFLCVLLVLNILLGEHIAWVGVPFAVLVFVIQCLFTYGMGLLFASVQVFLKDVAQLLPPLLMLWFYGSPILYPPTLVLPEPFATLVQLNPLTPFVNAYRDALLSGQMPNVVDLAGMLFATLIVCYIGTRVFRRLSLRFEDMY